MNKEYLYQQGMVQINKFAKLNQVTIPIVSVVPLTGFSACAYYRPSPKPYIKISLKQCANASFAESGRAWSFPGHMIDRTPYGVLAHEFGHHIDYSVQPGNGWQGQWSTVLRKLTKESPISGYCPDDGEWFAEMFRLYLTNPDLLNIVRPKTFGEIAKKFKPVEKRFWNQVLNSAPKRIHALLTKRTKT